MSGKIEIGRCRGPHCGRRIVWAVDQDGKKQPLEAVPTFKVLAVDERSGLQVQRVKTMVKVRDEEEVPMFLISHFKTCPDAKEFSRSKKGRGR